MSYKLGVIGYGNMGSWHCENVTNRINGLKIAAVYDIDEKRRKIATENGFFVCNTEDEFFKSDVDVILVATPNSFHKTHCISALLSGKNVISEKPACLNCEELDEIIEVANKTGKLYTVHQNRRFDIDYALIRKILSPYFGELIVTPSEIDSVIERVASLIAGGINDMVHNLS